MRVESHKKKGMLLSVTTAEEPNSSERPRRVNTFVFFWLEKETPAALARVQGSLAGPREILYQTLNFIVFGLTLPGAQSTALRLADNIEAFGGD